MFERLQLAWMVLTNKNVAAVVEAGQNLMRAVYDSAPVEGDIKVTFNDGTVKAVAYSLTSK